jgi:hypothetical protein
MVDSHILLARQRARNVAMADVVEMGYEDIHES